MKQIHIDLGGYSSNPRCFIGREIGQKAAQKINFNYNHLYQVKVPTEFYSINTSFFLGCFGQTVRQAGTKEAFLQQFNFVCTPEIMQDVEHGIYRALVETC